MTAKEKFLARIADQIATLQAAYDANKNLPDLFFEGFALAPSIPDKDIDLNIPLKTIINSSLHKVATTIANRQEAAKEQEYGANKRLIVKILNDTQKALTKAEIITKYKQELRTDEDQTNAVTNALASLQSDKSIKGYKPEGFKLRGYYWGLITWFDGETLLDQHKPFIQSNVFDKYKSVLG